jgi:hypothetical protein
VGGGFGQVGEEREPNDVNLDVGWKIPYRLIQWLHPYAQLPSVVSHYFAHMFFYCLLPMAVFNIFYHGASCLCLRLAGTLCRSRTVIFPCTDVFSNLSTR